MQGTGPKSETKIMSEQEWLEGTKTWFMLPHIPQPASERKLRLFACACVRRVWHLLPDERNWGAVEVAERFADGLAGERELVAAHATVPFLYPPPPDAEDATAVEVAISARASALACATDAAHHATTQRRGLIDPSRMGFIVGTANEVATCAAHASGWAAAAATRADMSPSVRAISVARGEAYWEEVRYQCDLLRCIFGNPFRPVSHGPLWQTPTVVSLAQAAYEERILPAGTLDPDRLAILADALEDAGCENADILSHLRGPGPHGRGCWVLDLLLGEE